MSLLLLLGDGSRPSRDWPEYQDGAIRTYAYDNGWKNGWWDNSWNSWVQPASDSQQSGMRGGPGACVKISRGVSSTN